MSSIQRVGDLEVSQDIDFQRRAWTVQRVGWGVMALFLLSGLVGLLGPGPLSKQKIGDQSGLMSLEYERFGRFRTPTTLRIHLEPSTRRSEQVRVWLNPDYLEGVEIRQITPQPDTVEAGGDWMVFVFRRIQLNQPTEVTFHLDPERLGSLHGQVGVAEGQPVSFSQFIYP
jgi:hypothetical protein